MHTRRGSSAGGSRAGRVRAWVPFLILFTLGVWLTEALNGGVAAGGFTRIDPRRAAFLDPAEVRGGGGFVDERWEDTLRATLAAYPPFDADDVESASGLVAHLQSLPFLAEVGTPRVLWPDGLELPVRLRRPVACARVQDTYLAVSDDGVLLPGGWPAPPWIGDGFLPVIGPNDRSLDDFAAGDTLTEPRHRDALAVAASMRAALGPTEFEVMGPVLIDASRARHASAGDPGVLLRLERRRLVYFGRAPDSGEPGELPVEAKWRALTEGLRVLRESQGQRDWAVLDARWDVPQVEWRDAVGG